MRREIPELAYLLSKVEEVFGRKPLTSSDFDDMTASVDSKTFQHVSTSTLKRLWGYVQPSPMPRMVTLDILSQYAGYSDFRHFCEELRTSEVFSSLFFSATTVLSRDLSEGACLTVGWAPDRVVELTYLGGDLFEVKDGGASQLKRGDRFLKSEFLLGKPLYIAKIFRGEDETPAYEAGKVGGLNLLKVSSKS